MDREHTGESPSHSPNYAGEGAGNQHRRKWHLNPVGARRYHELSKAKGGLAYQLLANLANTKRSITEIIERSRRSEWLKINSCDQEESYQVEIGETRREAKEQVKNTITNTSTYEWLKKNKNCHNFEKPSQELPKKTNDRTFRINSSTSLEMIHGSRVSLEDNVTTSRIRTEKRELRNKLIRKIRKRTEGVDEEDNRLLNANEEFPERPSERRRVVESFKTGTMKSTHGHLRERPAIVMPRLKHFQAIPIPAQKILSVERCVTRSREGLPPPEVTSTGIKQKIQTTLPDRTNMMFSARERPKVFINTKERQFQITPKKERLESNRMAPINKLSSTSIQVEPYYVLPRPVAKRFPEGSTENNGKRKEGEFSGSFIPNNSNAFTDVFNNITDIYTQNVSVEHNNNWECQFDARSEDNTYLLPSRSPSKESIPSIKFSDESFKWSFPNSNRKREEKLRELRDGTEYVETFNINTKGTNKVSKLNFTDTFSEMNRNQYLTNLLDHSDRSSAVNETEYDDDQKCILLEEMNTEAALMYLSETLIESAQRAELLLMQKMKEYNDLVCREPPPKNMQDNACQVNVPEVDTDFDKKFKEMVEKYSHELLEKNTRIKQLENEVKKAKLALKMNTLPGKKSTPEGNENQGDTEGNTTERATTSYPSNSKQHSAMENEQLVQALRLENNLLHNLLKEMKAELQQENATIFSLAKKLEISMTQTQNNQQTMHKHSARDTDNSVVRELEFKLEQQEKVLKKEAMEARAVAKYVIMKYTNLIAEYKQKVKIHQETVGKLKNAIK